jgi:hypothetical protein
VPGFLLDFGSQELRQRDLLEYFTRVTDRAYEPGSSVKLRAVRREIREVDPISFITDG